MQASWLARRRWNRLGKAQIFDEIIVNANAIGANADYDTDPEQNVVRFCFGQGAGLDPANYLRGAFERVPKHSLGWDRYKIVEVSPYHLRACKVLRALLKEMKIEADILVNDGKIRVVCKDPRPDLRKLEELRQSVDRQAGIGLVEIE